MSISKLRGKSALGRTCENSKTNPSTTAAANTSNNKLIKSTLPQTSLLKIEPFVPSFTTRHRRPIHRSYSTLSSNYFKRPTNFPHRLNGPNPDPNQQAGLKGRGKDRFTTQRQRSKSSGSSSSTINQATGAIVTQQPNGVCRITRSPQEKEKLPDRINYDRRGLGAIPIFENEANLRLLSLQHNLINVFHIPQLDGNDKPIQADDSKSEESNTNTTTVTSKAKVHTNNPRNGPISISYKRSSSPLVCVNTATNPFLTRFSPSSQQQTGTNSSRLLIKNSIILNSSTNIQMASNMRKSKSFISTYSKHLSSLKKNIHPKYSMVKAMEGAVNSAQASLDAGSAENVSDVLNVKNNQLNTSYGNVFHNLVFLDLYDNQIEKISNLDGLPSLTVLLLGKNRISDITGLSSLKRTLRVLDLHGNKITSINNKINCLQELKSLNLAGNQIRLINQNDFIGLTNLRELNLKRNKIKRVHGFNHLTSLERLWLCHNDLHKVEDMSSIAKAINLLEVTIENNPVSLAGDCVSFLVSYLPKLQMLSQMPITEQVRRAANAWRRNKELSDTKYPTLSSADVFSTIRREEVISNARTNWELLRSQQTIHNRQLATVSPTAEAEPTPTDINSSTIAEDPQQESVKLPPIQVRNQTLKPNSPGSNSPSEKTHSSASSLGPNVDSSSSCFSSDNEDRDVSTRCKRTRNCMPANESVTVNGSLEKSNPPNNATNEDVEPTNSSNEVQLDKAATIDIRVTAIATPTPSSSPPCNITAIIQNPSVTIVTQSTATTINNGNATNPEKSTLTTAMATGTGLPSFKSQQQYQRNSTMSLAINGNNNPASSASNANVTTKRYMHGSLTRSQTTKPSTSASNSAHTAATRALAQLSHHNSTANNGVATSGTGNGPSPGPSLSNSAAGTNAIAASSNNNSNCTAGGVTSSTTTTTATITTTTTTSTNATTTLSANKTSTTTTSAATINPSATTACTAKQVLEREREQGGDYLIEICGRYLNVYGSGALRFIDKQWNAQKAGDVHTLNFSYINFNNITAVLGRIKVRFQHAEHYVFRETNISFLGQLNALAELQGITSLTIDSEGNPICEKDWRPYAIYRLSHWGLKNINGQEVTETDINAAHDEYSGLSDLVLWSMPNGTLQPLLARLRLDESCVTSKLTPKEWLMKADDTLKMVVSKEALQWKKGTNGDFEHASVRERGRVHLTQMIENTCNAIEKLQMLEQLWPSMLLDIVRNTLLDYSQLDAYLKNLMAEIMK